MTLLNPLSLIFHQRTHNVLLCLTSARCRGEACRTALRATGPSTPANLDDTFAALSFSAGTSLQRVSCRGRILLILQSKHKPRGERDSARPGRAVNETVGCQRSNRLTERTSWRMERSWRARRRPTRQDRKQGCGTSALPKTMSFWVPAVKRDLLV